MDLRKGALAGAIAGVAGALAMSGFASLRSRIVHKGGLSRHQLSNLEARRYVSGSKLELDSITMATDQFDRLLGHTMSPNQKSAVAAAVHFKLGALLGATYGAIAEVSKVVTAGHGTAFAVLEAGAGNVVWTVATRGFRRYSLGDQIDSIIDHAVYGVVLESLRKLVRGQMDGR